MKPLPLTLLASFLVLGVSLAGCSDRNTDPPILVFEEIRYWFENDLLVLNVTVKNVGNYTPNPVKVAATLTEYRALNQPSHPGPGNDLKWVTGHSLSLEFANWTASPTQERYYDNKVWEKYGTPRETGFIGPVSFPPNQSRSFEMVFLPDGWMGEGGPNGTELKGYYTVWIRIPGFNFETKADIGEDLQTGCFNHDWHEFYGLRSDGPDCVYYNKERDDTNSEYALQKGLGDANYTLGSPMMIHDPPEGVEGAH